MRIRIRYFLPSKIPVGDNINMNNGGLMKLKPQEFISQLILKGLSEKQIARKVKVSQSTIHRIKVGDTIYPRIDTAEKIYQLYEKMNPMRGG